METQPKLYDWRGVAPALGVIFVSPAILAVGCTLGTMLPLAFAVLTSVATGICISLFIYFHGGIGAATHKPFTGIMEASLGEEGSRFLASPLITVTQVGWFAVLVGLGGEAASALTGLDRLITISVFGIVLAAVTYSGFGHLSDFTKVTAILTAIFAIWALYAIIAKGPYFLPTPTTPDSILMAAGLAIGGATSISTVSPDFIMQSRTPRDVKITAFGVVLPLILFTLISGNIMGSFTALPNPVLALVVMGLPVLANLLLLLGSCAGASSLYPPSLALEKLLRMRRKPATLPAAVAGLALAYLGIVEQLSFFLRAIDILLPPLIGISLAEYYLISKRKLEGRRGLVWVGALSWAVGAAVGLVPLAVPPMNALLSSLVAYWALSRWKGGDERASGARHCRPLGEYHQDGCHQRKDRAVCEGVGIADGEEKGSYYVCRETGDPDDRVIDAVGRPPHVLGDEAGYHCPLVRLHHALVQPEEDRPDQQHPYVQRECHDDEGDEEDDVACLDSPDPPIPVRDHPGWVADQGMAGLHGGIDEGDEHLRQPELQRPQEYERVGEGRYGVKGG